MRVIGIDPGSGTTGYGVVERVQNRCHALAWGTIATAGAATYPAALRRIHEELQAVIRQHQPLFAAVEDIFFAVNPRTSFKLAQSRGAILLSLELAGVPAFAYTPLSIKKSLVGYGRASKEQVREMVRLVLGLRGQEIPIDASDALAAALCHIQTYSTQLRLEREQPRRS